MKTAERYLDNQQLDLLAATIGSTWVAYGAENIPTESTSRRKRSNLKRQLARSPWAPETNSWTSGTSPSHSPSCFWRKVTWHRPPRRGFGLRFPHLTEKGSEW